MSKRSRVTDRGNDDTDRLKARMRRLRKSDIGKSLQVTLAFTISTLPADVLTIILSILDYAYVLMCKRVNRTFYNIASNLFLSVIKPRVIMGDGLYYSKAKNNEHRVMSVIPADEQIGRVQQFREHCLCTYALDGNLDDFVLVYDKLLADTIHDGGSSPFHIEGFPSIRLDRHLLNWADSKLEKLFKNALRGGDVTIIKTVYEKMRHQVNENIREDHFLIAIQKKNLEVFEYLMQTYMKKWSQCPPGTVVFMAVKHNALDIISWLITYGFPWSSDYNRTMLEYCSLSTIRTLTRYYRLSFPLRKDDSLFVAGTKRIDVLEWMFDTYPENYFDESDVLCKKAIIKGKTDTLIWLKTRFGFTLKSDAYDSAIFNNSIAEMESLYSLGVPLNVDVLKLASQDYRFRSIFRWIIAKKSGLLKDSKSMTKLILSSIARSLDFELLEIVLSILRSDPKDGASYTLSCLDDVLCNWNERKKVLQARLDETDYQSDLVKFTREEAYTKTYREHPMTSVIEKKSDGTPYNFDNIIDLLDWGFTHNVFEVHVYALRYAIREKMLDVVKRIHLTGFKWPPNCKNKSEYEYSVKHIGKDNKVSKYLKEREETKPKEPEIFVDFSELKPLLDLDYNSD